MVKEGIMKLHWDIPIKKKTKIYISIIAVTFLVFYVPKVYWNYKFNHIPKHKQFYIRTTNMKLKDMPAVASEYFDGLEDLKLLELNVGEIRGKPTDISLFKNVSNISAFKLVGFKSSIFDLNLINQKLHLRYAEIYNLTHSPNKDFMLKNKDLVFFKIENSKVKTIIFPEKLNLEFLILRRLDVDNIIGVENLKELKKLDLINTLVTDLSPLKKLEELSVNVLGDLSFLQDLKSLKKLNLWYYSKAINVHSAEKEYEKVKALERQLQEFKASNPQCAIYSNFTDNWE